MGDAGGGGGTGGVTGVSARSAERRLPRLHQPALPWRPRLLPRCRDTTVTWAQRTTDLELGASPDIQSLGRVCSLPAPTSGGEGTTASDGCRGAGHPHRPPNSTGSPREQGRWLRRGASSGCTSTSQGVAPKSTWAAAAAGHTGPRAPGPERATGGHEDPSSPRSRQRPQRRQRRALCRAEAGQGRPSEHKGPSFSDTGLCHHGRTVPGPTPAGTQRGYFMLCFLFVFPSFKEKWWEALLGYVCAPAAASASPAEPRAPAPLIFVHSLTRCHPRVAPSNLGVLHALPAGFSGLQRADSCSPGLTGRPVGAHHTSVMSWKQAQALKRREGRAVVQTVQRGLLKR